jgi:hypothetical protein
MTNFTRRARTLGLALTIAASVLGTSAVSASAQDNGPADPGVRCAAKVGPGQYEFYLPGERATDVNGNKWVCGPDGQWFRDYSALTIAPPKIKVTASYVVASTTATIGR